MIYQFPYERMFGRAVRKSLERWRSTLATGFGKPEAEVIAAAEEETEAERLELLHHPVESLEQREKHSKAASRIVTARAVRAKAVERMEKGRIT